MKETTETRTIEVAETWYVAEDGTKFSNAENCKKYEESAEFAVRQRLDLKEILYDRELKDAKYYAFEALDALLENEAHESKYYIWTPKTEDDCKNYLQWVNLRTRGTCSGVADKKYFGDFTFKSTELKPGTTYIIEDYEDGGYMALVDKNSFLNAVRSLFDTLAE